MCFGHFERRIGHDPAGRKWPKTARESAEPELVDQVQQLIRFLAEEWASIGQGQTKPTPPVRPPYECCGWLRMVCDREHDRFRLVSDGVKLPKIEPGLKFLTIAGCGRFLPSCFMSQHEGNHMAGQREFMGLPRGLDERQVDQRDCVDWARPARPFGRLLHG